MLIDEAGLIISSDEISLVARQCRSCASPVDTTFA